MKLGQEIRLELPSDLANKKAAPSSVLRLRFASREEAARILNIAHVIGKTRLHLYETKNAEVSPSDGQSLNQSSLNNSSLNLEQTTYTHPEEFESSGQLRPEPNRASQHASQLSVTHASTTVGQRKSGPGLQTACFEPALPTPIAAPRGPRTAPEHQQRGDSNTSPYPTYSHQRFPLADDEFDDRDVTCSAPWQRDRSQGTGLSDPGIFGVMALTGAAVRTEDRPLNEGRDFYNVAVHDTSITKTHESHLTRPIVTHYHPQAHIKSFEATRDPASDWERAHPPGPTYSKSRQGLPSGFLLDGRRRDYKPYCGDEYESVHAHPADSQVYNQVDYSSNSRGNLNLNNTKSDYSSCELSNHHEGLGASSHLYRSGDKQQTQGPARRNPDSGFPPQRSEPEPLTTLLHRPGMDRQARPPAFISYDGYSSIHQDYEYSQESKLFTEPKRSNSLLTSGHQDQNYNTQQVPASREKLSPAGLSIFERPNEKEKESSFSEFFGEELAFLHPLGIFIEGRRKWIVNGEHQDFEPLTTDGTHVRFWDEFAINEPFFISREFSLWNGSSIKKLEDISLGIRIRRNLPAPDSRASIELKLDIISTTEHEFNELKKEAAEFRNKLISLMKSINTKKTWQETYPLKFMDAEELHLGEHATKSSSESRPLSGCRYEEPSIRKLDPQTAFKSREQETSCRISFTGQSDLSSVRIPTTRNVRSPRKISQNV